MAFEPKYDHREIINIDHFTNFKAIYSDALYLVLPNNNNTFSRRGKSRFNVFIRKRGEIIGDSLVVKELIDEFDYELYIYNQDNKVENILKMNLLDNGVSELECEFDKWTVSEKGIYTFEIVINNDIILKSGHRLSFN